MAEALQLHPLDASWATGQAVQLQATVHMQEGLRAAAVAVTGSWQAGSMATAVGLHGAFPDDFFTASDIVVRYSSSPAAVELEMLLDVPVLGVQKQRAVLRIQPDKTDLQLRRLAGADDQPHPLLQVSHGR
jgi:hypothetical protein